MSEKQDPDAYAMYIVVNESLNMSPGKVAAQVGHAVMELTEKATEIKISMYIKEYKGEAYESLEHKLYSDWSIWRRNCRKVVLKASPKEWRALKNIPPDSLIVDAGYTEVEPNSETVMAFWPMKKVEQLHLLKRLQLY